MSVRVVVCSFECVRAYVIAGLGVSVYDLCVCVFVCLFVCVPLIVAARLCVFVCLRVRFFVCLRMRMIIGVCGCLCVIRCSCIVVRVCVFACGVCLIGCMRLRVWMRACV